MCTGLTGLTSLFSPPKLCEQLATYGPWTLISVSLGGPVLETLPRLSELQDLRRLEARQLDAMNVDSLDEVIAPFGGLTVLSARQPVCETEDGPGWPLSASTVSGMSRLQDLSLSFRDRVYLAGAVERLGHLRRLSLVCQSSDSDALDALHQLPRATRLEELEIFLRGPGADYCSGLPAPKWLSGLSGLGSLQRLFLGLATTSDGPEQSGDDQPARTGMSLVPSALSFLPCLTALESLGLNDLLLLGPTAAEELAAALAPLRRLTWLELRLDPASQQHWGEEEPGEALRRQLTSPWLLVEVL